MKTKKHDDLIALVNQVDELVQSDEWDEEELITLFDQFDELVQDVTGIERKGVDPTFAPDDMSLGQFRANLHQVRAHVLDDQVHDARRLMIALYGCDIDEALDEADNGEPADHTNDADQDGNGDGNGEGGGGGAKGPDLESLTVPDLKALADVKEVDLGGATKKDDIVAKLREAGVTIANAT